MKRYLILLLVFVFIPFVNAQIVFNNDFYDKYNLGDSLNIEGYILETSNVGSIFRLYLDCGNSFQLAARTININANERYFFNERVSLPINYQGQCNFRSTFNDETRNSESFEITNSLKGSIFVNKNELKLGEELSLDGDIYKLSNDRINGVGIISLSKNNENYFLDTFDITDGNVLYNKVLINLPAGIYDLKLESYDSFGNLGVFNVSQNIKVSDQLTARVNLDKYELLQGTPLKISGEVDSDIKYKLLLEYPGNTPETLNFYDKSFISDIKIDKILKAGDYSVFVKIVDDYGNYYLETLGFKVIQVPAKILVDVTKEVFPSETVNVKASIYDKANQLYNDNIKVTITNPDDEDLASFDLSSGDEYKYDVPEYSAPGKYKVHIQSLDLDELKEFNIKTMQKIDAYFEDNRLKVKNIGNVNLNGDFSLFADSEKLFDLSFGLKPSEIQSYDLRGKMKQGIHDLKIGFNDQTIEIGNVDIQDDRSSFEKVTGFVVGGNEMFNNAYFYVIFVFVIVVALLLFFLQKEFKKRKREESYRRDYEHGRGASARIKQVREAKQPQKRSLFKAKDISREEADDFRKVMVDRMKER